MNTLDRAISLRGIENVATDVWRTLWTTDFESMPGRPAGHEHFRGSSVLIGGEEI